MKDVVRLPSNRVNLRLEMYMRVMMFAVFMVFAFVLVLVFTAITSTASTDSTTGRLNLQLNTFPNPSTQHPISNLSPLDPRTIHGRQRSHTVSIRVHIRARVVTIISRLTIHVRVGIRTRIRSGFRQV